MKPITYCMMTLFLLGIVFTVGNSFAQQRIDPFVSGQTQDQLTRFRNLVGRGPNAVTGGSVGAGYSSSVSGGMVFASTMISSELKTPQGDFLAEIRGLVIDPASGHVSGIVLGGIRGMGAKEVVVPFETVSRTGENIFIYRGPQEVSQFYSEAPYQRWGFYAYAKQHNPEGSYTTNKLIGATVRTPEREDLGRIDDLLIDAKDGHVVRLVVTHAGGMEGKMACVPFSILSRRGENVFVLKTTKQELKPCTI